MRSSSKPSFAAFATVAVTLLLLSASSASANCPSNGNTHAIYITSNMGDNIWSFDTQGTYVGEVINKHSFPADVRVDKLRAMRFGPGGHLYVSSARGSFSRIFAISGNGLVNNTMQRNCTRNYLFTATAQDASNPFLDHPYDMLFHPESNDLYVSNQNSVTITRYTYTPEKDGTPAWTPAANNKVALPTGKANSTWQQQQQKASATANAHDIGAVDAGIAGEEDGGGHGLPNADAPEVVAPEKVPANAGLFASGWSGKYYLNSVRGIALSPQLPRALVDGTTPPGIFTADNTSLTYYLLACDIATNAVHVFDAETGERLFGLWVPSPVQVMFPARFYSPREVTRTVTGDVMRQYDQPYIFVSSKEDAMTYMVRFSSRSSLSKTPGHTQSGIFSDDSYAPSHRMQPVTMPTPLHSGSGIYENPSRDVVLVADRNGRRVSSYASPFAYGDPSRESSGPSTFLGYFVKRLPDQPEFLLSVALESQRNIPYCYELAPDGTMRYVALCTAAHIWSIALLAALLLIPAILLYKQGKHYLRERRRKEKLRQHQQREAELEATTPLLAQGQEQRPLLDASTKPSYGTTA